MRATCIFAAAFLVWVSGSASAYDIVTGGASGTYIQIGRNIGALMQQFKVELNAVESAGSMENVAAVYKRRVTPLGIVQSDVLDFILTTPNDPELRKIARKIRMVFPLYNEEIHVLARPDVGSFEDLGGKRIGVGKPNSGTNLTATLLLATAGIRPAETMNVGASDAITAMRHGRLDAMIYVAGIPTKLFQEGVTGEDQFKLLPIVNPQVLEFYLPAEIPAGTYPWQSAAVQSVTVKAVLVTYDFPSTSDYLRKSCNAVAKVTRAISDNMAWLRQNGHPKWRQVDLTTSIPGWKPGRCVLEGLDPNRPTMALSGQATTNIEGQDPNSCGAGCAAIENPVARNLCRIKCGLE